MQNELDILRDVALRLEKGRIDYMLTGSTAMNYYAEPRMTRDIDIVVALGAGTAGLIVAMFEPDYYVSQTAVEESISKESMFNLIHQESVIKVDCIVRKGSPYRLAEFERRQRVSLGDFSIWIASKEDLIISKLWWAKEADSELQRRDVRNLVAAGCDEDYIGRWTSQLGLSSLWEECRK